MAQKEPRGKKPGIIKQVVRIYGYTHSDDKALPWVLAGAFLLPVAVAVLLGVLFHWSVLSWVLFMVSAVSSTAHMPKAERLPWRIYIRDHVDARFNLGEFFIPVALVMLVCIVDATAVVARPDVCGSVCLCPTSQQRQGLQRRGITVTC